MCTSKRTLMFFENCYNWWFMYFIQCIRIRSSQRLTLVRASPVACPIILKITSTRDQCRWAVYVLEQQNFHRRLQRLGCVSSLSLHPTIAHKSLTRTSHSTSVCYRSRLTPKPQNSATSRWVDSIRRTCMKQKSWCRFAISQYPSQNKSRQPSDSDTDVAAYPYDQKGANFMEA